MNARIIKESRAIMPAFLVCVGLTLTVNMIWHRWFGWWASFWLFVISGAFMGANVFGAEFQHQTLPSLLAQPISRQKIWWEKMTVLGLAALLGFLAWVLWVGTFADFDIISGYWKPENRLYTILALLCLAAAPLAIWCTTPYYAICARSSLTGTLLAFLNPIGILIVMGGLIAGIEWLFKIDESKLYAKYPALNMIVPALACAAVLIYCGVYCWLGYRRFMRFQAIDAAPQEFAISRRIERLLARPISRLLPGYRGPLRSLVRKELQLQRAAYVIAGMIALLTAVELVTAKLYRTEVTMSLPIASCAILVIVLPLVITGVSVAEERGLGVAGWQQTLPVSARKQWTTKLGVTVGTAVLLSVILPALIGLGAALLLSDKPWTVGEPRFHSSQELQTEALTAYGWVCGYLLFLGLGIFASSLCVTGFKSILLHLTLMAGVCGAIFGPSSLFIYLADHLRWPSSPGGSSGDLSLLSLFLSLMAPLAKLIFMVLPLAVIICPYFLGHRNYRAGTVGRKVAWIQSAILVGIAGIATTLWWIIVSAS